MMRRCNDQRRGPPWWVTDWIYFLSGVVVLGAGVAALTTLVLYLAETLK